VVGKKPTDILKLRIIDTACGSGSFLIAAYDYLLSVIESYLQIHPKEARKNDLVIRDGEPRLSLKRRREILINCIYGVDIDPQAVEVAQLSLYLKLMEDETANSAHQNQIEMGAALLPSLSSNIVIGNSLVTLDDRNDLFDIGQMRKTKSLNFKT